MLVQGYGGRSNIASQLLFFVDYLRSRSSMATALVASNHHYMVFYENINSLKLVTLDLLKINLAFIYYNKIYFKASFTYQGKPGIFLRSQFALRPDS